jgi:hypothetical protein
MKRSILHLILGKKIVFNQYMQPRSRNTKLFLIFTKSLSTKHMPSKLLCPAYSSCTENFLKANYKTNLNTVRKIYPQVAKNLLLSVFLEKDASLSK